MKILIDARLYGLENTGVGRYLIHLIEELSHLDKDNEYKILLRKKYFDTLVLPENWEKISADYGVYGIKEQVSLLKVLRRLKPDIAHFPNFNIPFFWNGKFMVTLHDLTTHRASHDSSKLPTLLFWVKKIVYKILYSVAVNKSVKIIVPTQTVKNEIHDYYKIRKDKIVVTHEGIDLYFQNVDAKYNISILNKYNLEKNKYLIHCGNIYPHKNIRKVVDALKVLGDKHPEIKLVLVTKKNHFSDSIYEYAKAQNLTKKVILTGFLSDRDLKSLYKFSTAYIYPSLMEGFGLQGLEALATGTKLLASDIAVFREVYEDCAFYFDPMNHYSIANAIEKVLASQQKDGVKDLLKKYSWSKMAKEVAGLYYSAK